eukprot:9061010-Ditylum_brightwellii.AAC.1
MCANPRHLETVATICLTQPGKSQSNQHTRHSHPHTPAATLAASAHHNDTNSATDHTCTNTRAI